MKKEEYREAHERDMELYDKLKINRYEKFNANK